MRERESWRRNELKWVKWLTRHWLSVSQQAEMSTESTERVRDEWWSEREVESLFDVFVWSELKVGFNIWLKRCVLHLFFFFWISAWIGRYGRFRSIRPKLARFKANWPESKPHRRESAKTDQKPRGMTRRDAAERAGSGIPCISPHRTWVRHLWCHVRAS